ncbi:MAG: HD domain-containing protein [Lachnospiraceae bacterium]|nr:HD domain-containing protein [Lachnospiraceae bacterium]
MRGIPLKIFCVVLLTGLIGIAGEIILKYDIDQLSSNYNNVAVDVMKEQEYSLRISALLYRHQAVLASCLIAEDQEQVEGYLLEEKELRERLKTKFSELGKQLKGSDMESLYHQVYSDYTSYLSNADIALQLCQKGSIATASYYVNNTLEDFLSDVDDDIEELEQKIDGVMEDARKQMDYYIRFTQITEIVCVVCIVVAVLICIIYCVKSASGMERQEKDLKRAMDVQHNTLMAHVKHLMDMQDNIILGMANLIENRDGDTGEHIKRTSQYVEMLARKAQEAGMYPDILTDEYIMLLVKAAPMHDVGKISVPDRILQKPGRLTEEEFEQMKRHAPEGGRIVREVFRDVEDEKYIEIASQVAAYHHEKWDGNGYTAGLSGEEIPLSARIMALADVFDALVSKRCYKDAMSYDKAFQIIEESAGTHFDPQLTEIFLDMREEILEVLS